NALPAHIVVIDFPGIIVSVNDGWRRFAESNMLPGTGLGIGIDYLAVCDSAQGANTAEASQAAVGIRSVLNGTATSFLLEYACHSPTQQRWFQMTVTPLNDEQRTGAVVMHLDISERRRAESALEDLSQKTELRERILSTTLACISDFAYIFDREGCFLFANQPLLDLWGLTLDEAVGKDFFDLGYPPDLATQLQREVQQVFDTKTSLTGETPYTNPSGLIGYYEYIFSPVINDDGRVELVVGSTRDVTARKFDAESMRISAIEQRHLADQLEIERSRLVAAQRVAKIGSWETDLTNMSLIWSEETHRIHETDPVTFHPTVQGYLDLVHPMDREAVVEAYRQSLCNVGRCVLEHRLSLPGGRIKVVEKHWRVILDQNENPIRLIGTCQDITERKEMEAARERLAAILESTPDLVGISDPEGHVLYLNHAGRDVLGFGQQEDLSQIRIPDFLRDPENHPALKTGIPAAVRDGNWRGETVLQSRNGLAIPVSQVILAHKSSDGKLEYLSTIMRDITERKEAQQRIAFLNRVYAMLSGINSLIVRVHNRDELFREACHVAVEAGGFRMAMIAVVDPSTLKIVPVASAGKQEELLTEIKSILASSEHASKTMCARAIKAKNAIVANDSQSDPQVLFSVKYTESGVRSIAVFPLIVEGEVVGVLALYAGEIEFFHEEEMKLLTELTGDIAFAIDFINKAARLNHLAYYDALTGLPNRSLLHDRLNHAIAHGERYHDPIWVVFLNMDRFALVNSTLGHQAGDELIRSIAARLQNLVRETDTLARIGGDEFVMVMPARTDERLDSVLVPRLMDAIAQPFTVGEHELFLTCSVGVAIYPINGENAETLIKHADIAMHRARTTGSNSFQFYEGAMNEFAIERLRMVSDLRHAVKHEEFVLHYQPQVDFYGGHIVGTEALIRWNHPQLGLLPPARFIELAEETGLIVPIGEWVIRTACRQNKAWQDAGLGNFRVAVNLSARHFAQPYLVQTIAGVLQETGLEACHLEIELTESMVMTDVEQAIEILSQLKSLGLQLSIDDFGTGYSSLAYLKRFPIDALKIDRSFVRDIAVDSGDAAIAKAIVAMAHSIGIRVIAEGVEDEQQCDFLRQQMCDELQGFFFSKPLVPTEIEALLRQGRCLPAHLRRWQKPPRTLLIVDDEVNIVAALKRLLRPDNYRILTANSGQEGLNILAQYNNAVDVIISDQRMPGMTGVEFLRKAKDLHPATIRIVLSGYTELQSVTDAVNEGAIYKFFTKPWDDEKLRAHIADAFRQKQLTDENQRLSLEIQTANQELAASNRKMSEMLKLQHQQIQRARSDSDNKDAA
ncbi:MAG: EAL domain-containing protein, partial [Burkholderiaceae bacterium]